MAPNAPSTWNQIFSARSDGGDGGEVIDGAGIHGAGGADDEEGLQAGFATSAAMVGAQRRDGVHAVGVRPPGIRRSASEPMPAMSSARGMQPWAAADA